MLEQHLVILLMKLAASAALASILGRSSAFLRMLTREERTTPQRLQMAVGFAVIFGGGIVLRVLTNNNYQALDLGLEGALLAGVLGGYLTGLTGGLLISLPACLLNGEWMAMLLYAGLGVTGGLLRDLAPSKDDIWRFSPYLDLTVYRIFRAKYDIRVTLFHGFVLLVVVFAEFARWALSKLLPNDRLLYTLYSSWKDPDWLGTVLIYSATIFAFAIPLKIWNSIRQEQLLGAQQRLLTEARLRALTSQINPHFLFNTLNTVNSLIRTNPEQARGVVRKLSNILRRLLRKDENFSPLRDEINFINDYLSIEMTRFGEKLRFVNETEPATLDRLVPSMLLQPIIENSIKHGLSSKVEGGVITLRTRLRDARLHIEIEDDGVGVEESKLATVFDSGIGVSNVNERLQVLFGDDYRMDVDSRPGEGTRTHIEFPDLNGRRYDIMAQPLSMQTAVRYQTGRLHKTITARTKRVYDHLSRVYPASTYFFHRKAHKAALEMSGLQDGMQVLEVATGSGEMFRRLVKSNPGGRTYGVDLSPKMAARTQAHARKQFPESGSHCQAVDCRTLPYKDGTFDSIFSCYLYEQLSTDDIYLTLEEMYRVLKPRGQLTSILVGQQDDFFNKAYLAAAAIVPAFWGVQMDNSATDILEATGFRVTQKRVVRQSFYPSHILTAVKD